MSASTALRGVLTGSVIARIVLGWVAVALLSLASGFLTGSLSMPLVFTLLALIVGVIIACSGGVVTQAEYLAHRLGDPYGTLVLTLSIVGIEVILISAVMLGPGDHHTIARDSVMATVMIVLNLVIGLALIVGGMRHNNLQVNRAGISAYLSMLVVLIATAFAIPAVIGTDGAYNTAQAITIVTLTVILYAFFLYRQTGAQHADFTETDKDVVASGDVHGTELRPGIGAIFREHKGEIFARAMVLLITVIPIVLLSHDMASLLDDGLNRLGAPIALSGIIIAMIVFLPEAITTVRAAWGGEGQRVVNLAHGALVSCVGLTLPVVLIIGLLTGQTVTLAENPTNLLLLGISLALSIATFNSRKVTAIHGGAHLFVFILYALSIFS
ncbi:calcium:proton antiporter [Corynebacterium sp. J010B-136]|uniref:calcium:proton antiporter n=1 Tax=Corynebacterium sp. J010B-136 TaxID=2099401 RepID=UPI000CF95E6D|nr:calcium:proton antiporter [Corynebacterium sp. J010B-136]PQM74000.1 calcium:proton antiporter [Corynebacterium sp. J010B-136]